MDEKKLTNLSIQTIDKEQEVRSEKSFVCKYQNIPFEHH